MSKKPADHLSLQLAVEIAESLHAIPDAPRFPGSLKATVRDLQEWCTGCDTGNAHITAIAQARWLEAEARRNCEKWPGPAGLRAIFEGKFNPAIKPFDEVPVKPAVKCEHCHDTGVVAAESPGPRTILGWCACDHGQWLSINVPNYLDLCRQREATREAARRIPVPTQEEIEAIKRRQEQNRKER